VTNPVNQSVTCLVTTLPDINTQTSWQRYLAIAHAELQATRNTQDQQPIPGASDNNQHPRRNMECIITYKAAK